MTNCSYDQTSQLYSMQYPNGVEHAFTYDNRDRPINLNVTGPLSIALSYAQTFSPSGRKTNVTEQIGRESNYSYSSVYRLLSENISSDPAPANNGALNYMLDAVGNRLSLISTLAALPNQTNTYDANDRLASDTYDSNGNTLASGGHNFSYDFEDRLTQFDSSVQMSYDGDGNRIIRTQGGTTTRYLIDDLTQTGYPQIAEEVVNGAVVAQFTYGSWRISQNRSGVLSYYGYDGGSSARQLFSATGAITDTYAYDAFGNTVAQSGSTINEFLYRGEQYDVALQMYYLRARYYVPRTGRFLTQDIEAGTPGRPITQHRYIYAYADPANMFDPSGHGFLERAQLVILAILASPAVQQAGEEARGWISLATNSWLRANQYYDIFFENAKTWGDIIRGTKNVVASGQFLDEAGNVIRATAVSGNRWIPELREAVEKAGEVVVDIPESEWNEFVDGSHHAEQLLLQWAQESGHQILSIAAAGQEVCPMCVTVLQAASDSQLAAYGFGFPFIP